MAKYTFDTNAEQDAAIALSHQQTSPESPLEDFIVTEIQKRLGGITATYIEMRVQKVVDAYRTATPEQRAIVDQALNITLTNEVVVGR